MAVDTRDTFHIHTSAETLRKAARHLRGRQAEMDLEEDEEERTGPPDWTELSVVFGVVERLYARRDTLKAQTKENNLDIEEAEKRLGKLGRRVRKYHPESADEDQG